ncbi:MAG: 16S rRNA (guanine(527)-N(7))-methyltransferase RsmG [Legionella sp.]|nr:MAG: 16S rRNA (guanine(527)-N(7))-methyltransferase RsmG [Legionella sp.]
MNDQANIRKLLEEGLPQFIQGQFGEALFQYLLLLNKWNSAYNLTAIRKPEEMVTKHIFDSLAILPWVQGQRLIDVGTGAGLPGVVLAIAKPDSQFVLLDSNGKKIRFLQEVKRQLSLNNIEIVQSRVENFHPALGFDTVISRAFSTLEQMLHWTQHLIRPDGIWLAMKGRYPDTELETIHQPYTVESYTVAGIDGERCCVLIKNTIKE